MYLIRKQSTDTASKPCNNVTIKRLFPFPSSYMTGKVFLSLLLQRRRQPLGEGGREQQKKKRLAKKRKEKKEEGYPIHGGRREKVFGGLCSFCFKFLFSCCCCSVPTVLYMGNIVPVRMFFSNSFFGMMKTCWGLLCLLVWGVICNTRKNVWQKFWCDQCAESWQFL